MPCRWSREKLVVVGSFWNQEPIDMSLDSSLTLGQNGGLEGLGLL